MAVTENIILQSLPVTDPPVLYRVINVNEELRTAHLLQILYGRFHIHTLDLAELGEMNFNILTYDLYEKYMRPLSDFTLGAQQRIQRATKFITELEIICGDNIFERRVRGQAIEDLRKQHGISKMTAYLYLRTYWESGKLFNALGGNLYKCGGKGKRRIAQSGDAKRGRPPHKGKGLGVNLTPEYRKIFEDGYMKYVRKQRLSKEKAYQRICENDLFRYEIDEETGELVKVVLKWWNRPSDWQFYTFCREEESKDPEGTAIDDVGIREFNLNHRSMKQSSTTQAFGPGSLYQFDASPMPFAFRNALDTTEVITGATLYMGADTYTHGIAGFALSLVKESWEGYSLLLANCFSDKVEFCAQYGIEITRDDFPFDEKPVAILADRGPLKGKNADSIAEVGIALANTAPYRADMKGIVEWVIEYIQAEVIRDEDGYRSEKKRGQKDYRLDAIFTVEEFMPRLIRAILKYNKYHIIKPYPFTELMIENAVSKTPLGLSAHGKSFVGLRPRLKSTTVRRQFYYRDTVSVRADGIYFRSAYYEPLVPKDNSEKQKTKEELEGVDHLKRLIQKAAWKKERYRVDMRYDKFGPMHTIWVVYKDSLVECVRRANDDNTKTLHNRTHEEVEAYNKLDSIQNRDIREEKRQQTADDNAKNDAEKAQAKQRTKKAIDESGISNRGQIINTRQNTADARDHERMMRYLEENGLSESDGNITPNNNTEPIENDILQDPKNNASYVPPVNYTNMFIEAFEEKESHEE